MRVFKRIAIGDLSHRVQQTSRLQHRVLQSSAWCSALAHRLVSCEKYYILTCSSRVLPKLPVARLQAFCQSGCALLSPRPLLACSGPATADCTITSTTRTSLRACRSPPREKNNFPLTRPRSSLGVYYCIVGAVCCACRGSNVIVDIAAFAEGGGRILQLRLRHVKANIKVL